MVEVELPYPPSVNHYWRHVGSRVHISAKGRAFRRKVRLTLRALDVRPLDGALKVTVDLHPPDRRRRDVDNAMKALLDALEHGGAYHDDGQIDRLEVERRCIVKGGKCVVTIEEMKRC